MDGKELLKLDDNYRITTDKYNYILQEYQLVQPRKGKEDEYIERYEWRDIGYFGQSLTGLLKKYLNEYIKNKSNTSIEELIGCINLTNKRIEEVVAKNKERLESISFQ